MKKILNGIFSLLIVYSLLGCGGASPPAGIPAPVSQLLAVSNPDASGNVTLSGDPGAVNGGATVTATNVTQTATSIQLQEIFIRKAYAGTLPPVYVATTTAAPDGSFRLTLTAGLGDQIEVVQEVNGEISDPTILTVSGNTVGLSGTVRGLAADGSLAVAYPASGLNGQGQVFALNFLDNTPTSLPNPDFQFPDFGGITEISVNGTDRRGLAVSPTDNTAFCFDLDNPNTTVPLGLTASPVSVDIQPFDFLAAIGVQSDIESVGLFDTAPCNFICSFLIQHPQGSAHVATRFVNLRLGIGGASTYVIALSEFADGSFWLTKVDVTGPACPGSVPIAQVELPAGINPGGLGVYNSANDALVSDAGGNQVYAVNFGSGSMTAVSAGPNPMGIAVAEAGDFAYVVNRADNAFSSVSKINLSNLSVTTQEGAGLMPTHIGLFDEFEQAVVLSSSNDAVTLINTNF